eukprot:4428656-Amphidinium_carterae.1
MYAWSAAPKAHGHRTAGTVGLSAGRKGPEHGALCSACAQTAYRVGVVLDLQSGSGSGACKRQVRGRR